MENFDLIVIGAGPGGYVAAIRAAQLGLKTAVVEKENLGGICLNWGCIPTKALLRSAEVYHTIQHASDFGIEVGDIKFNFKKIIERSRQVSKKLSDGIAHLMKKNNITVIKGHAKLLSGSQISITGDKEHKVQAKNIILATGARARILPGMEPDKKYIWTYKEAMIAESLPKSLLVVGSGAIGMEFASFYNMLGSDVTIIEVANRILGAEDHEIAAIAHKAFEKRGIKIHTGASVKQIEKGSDDVQVKFLLGDKEHNKKFDRVIVAAGVVANTESIGLENTKVQIEKGFIKTDAYGKTDEPSIWAIGDVASPPWLAHKASHEAIICVEKIAGQSPHSLNKKNIPGCTYCYPQIASIGHTEEQAKNLGLEIRVGRFPLMANGKAIAMGETEGMVKTIFDAKTGELLGAHMIGSEVTEMIQGFAMAKTLEATEAEIINTVFPHPTISETMHESTLAAHNRVIHT